MFARHACPFVAYFMIQSVLEGGFVRDWDIMEKLLSACDVFMNESIKYINVTQARFSTTSCTSPPLTTRLRSQSRHSRRRCTGTRLPTYARCLMMRNSHLELVQLLFEAFNVPALQFTPSGILTLYGACH